MEKLPEPEYSESVEQEIEVQKPEEEVSEINSSKDEIRTFTKEYSPWARKSLADQIKYIRTLRSLQDTSSEEFRSRVDDARDVFYARFAEQKNNFENSSLETSVENVSEKYGVILVHTFPIEGMSRWNTSMNNKEIKAESLNSGDILLNIVKNKPDLSCSSISIEKRFSSLGDETMYPIGVVLQKGTILSAYRYDAGTLTEQGVKHKKSKYDPGTVDTSIQDNVVQKIDDVLTRKYDRYKDPETGYYDVHRDYKTGEYEPAEFSREYKGDLTSEHHAFDEFVISDPSIEGLYVNLDDDRIKGEWNGDVLARINAFVQSYPDVPVYIKQKGQLNIYAYDSEGNVRVIESPEDLKTLNTIDKYLL